MDPLIMDGTYPLGHSFRAEWAKQLVLSKLVDFWNTRPEGDLAWERVDEQAGDDIEPDTLPNIVHDERREVKNLDGYKVGIIGAGVAGLFTAMTIDYLNKEVPDLGLSYEILEATSKDRFGGRLYTHRFSSALHDYYDVGAMRFPYIPIMYQTFDLFHTLGFVFAKEPRPYQPPGPLPETVQLIPYHLQGNKCPYYFNDLHYDEAPWKKRSDPFKVKSKSDREKIPADVLRNPVRVMSKVFEYFKAKLRIDAEQGGKDGWNALMSVDSYSVRQYLARSPDDKTPLIPRGLGFNFRTIEYLETFNSGTLNFDESFSESVLGSLDFDYYSKELEKNFGPEDVEWWCIEGGTQQVADAMMAKLTKKPTLDTPVTKIKLDITRDVKEQMMIRVGPAQDDKSLEDRRYYSAIFNSTTFACLQRMDLTDAVLNYGTKLAIRCLRYGNSCKIGIKFRQPWWINRFGINKGGAGYTDLPLRICVYPSYNISDGSDKEAVLLCSYTWGADAERLAALISQNTTEARDELKGILFHNLALLHSPQTDHKLDEKSYDETYQAIKSSYVDHHAYTWGDDPLMSGAFAHFGPGQFSKMYPDIITPSAGGKLFLIGEATSKHHAWIVGALESAVRGVYQFLDEFKGPIVEAARKKLEVKLKDNPFFVPYEERDPRVARQQVFIASVREEAKRGNREA